MRPEAPEFAYGSRFATARAWWSGLAAILLLYGLMGSVGLAATPRFFDDEAWESSQGWVLAHEGRLRNPTMSGCGGMDVYFVQTRVVLPVVCSGFYALADTGITTCRVASIAVGALALIGVALLARRWFGPVTGLGAAALLALHPWFFEIARRARPEIHATALAVLGLWLLSRAVETNRRGGAAGAVLALTGLTHPIGWLAAASSGAGVLWASPLRAVLRRAPAVLAGALCVLLPFVAYVVWASRHPEVDFLEQMHACGTANPNVLTHYGKGLWLTWRAFFQWPLGAPLAVITLASFAAAWRGGTRQDRAAAVALALLLGLAPYGKTQMYRNILVILPLLSLLLARLIERLVRCDRALLPGRPRWSRGLAGGLAAVYAAISVGSFGLLQHRLGDADLEAVFERIGRTVGSESLVYGPMMFWLGHEHYRFHPLLKERLYENPSETLREAGVDYVVRTAWRFQSSHALRVPPDEMPESRATGIDLVAASHGILVERFRDPYYGPIEIYRMPWSTRSTEGSPERSTRSTEGSPERSTRSTEGSPERSTRSP